MPAKGKTQTTSRSAAADSYRVGRGKKTNNAAVRRKKTMEAAARRKTANEVAEEVITDPDTIKSIECGLEDLKAGRVKPWKEVKRNV